MLVEIPGEAWIQDSYRSQFGFPIGYEPFLFETSCSFSGCLFHQPPLYWAVSSHWPPENGGILATNLITILVGGKPSVVR
jgi:hypothetical protein